MLWFVMICVSRAAATTLQGLFAGQHCHLMLAIIVNGEKNLFNLGISIKEGCYFW